MAHGMVSKSWWLGAAWMLSAIGVAACVPGEDVPDSGQSQACGSRGLGPCDQGSYCKFPASAACGTFDAPGVCSAVPRICTKEYAPVCGCDGTTYGNACEAASASVSVAGEGACPSADGGAGGADAGAADASSSDASGPSFCGGFAGILCPDGSYCDFPLATRCGSGDQGGSCAPIPEVCPFIVDPVCGCDGNTYNNSCAAAAAGVSVASTGGCLDADAGTAPDAGAFAAACWVSNARQICSATSPRKRNVARPIRAARAQRGRKSATSFMRPSVAATGRHMTTHAPLRSRA